MIRRTILAILLGLCGIPSLAQYTSISGAAVKDGQGHNLSVGTVCFTPYNVSGTITPITPAGGSPLTGPFCTMVNNGAFTAVTLVPNLATASPTGLNYQMSVYNAQSAPILTVNWLTSVNGASWVYDSALSIPVSLNNQASSSGVGNPYLPCSDGATYSRTDTPTNTGWTCTVSLGYFQWFQGGNFPAPSPSQTATIPVVAQMIQAYLATAGGGGSLPGGNGLVKVIAGAGAVATPNTDYVTPSGSISGSAGTAGALTGTPTICTTGQAPRGIGANGNVTGCQIYVVPSGSITGNAATATALQNTPTLCSSGQSPTGVDANGNATGCQAVGGNSVSGQDIHTIPLPGSGTTITGQSHITEPGDGVTHVSQPIVAPSVISGTPTSSAKAACTPISGSHCAVMDESGTAGVPAAGVDYSRADSVTHRIVQSVNGGAESPVVTDLVLASPPCLGCTNPAPSIATQINSGSYQAQANQTGGGNNGISNSAAALSSGGAIVAEPTYGTTEEPNSPDATLPSSAFAAKTQFLDLRYGSRTEMYVNPARNEQEGNQQYIGAARYCYNTTLPNLDITNLFTGVQCATISQFNYLAGYDPGYSGGSGGGAPMGDNALAIQQNSWMAGIHSGVTLLQNIYSGSDQILGFSTNAVVKPALIRPSQEGTKYRDQVFESNTGTATVATGGSHATTIGMASQGGDFGIFTIAVDAQAGNVRSGTTGTCTTSSLTTNVNVVTCPVSGFTPVATTASGTLGAGFTFTPTDPTGAVPTLHAVSGTATVSTGTLNIGDLMCIPDTDYYEQVRVAAVSPNLQYSSYYPHPSGTLFYAGGECGGQIEFTSKTLTVGGNPKRYLQQVISSTGSSITFAYKQQAQYVSYSENSASIKLYAGAMVQGIQPPTCRNCAIAGLILQANNGAWTVADAVEDDNNISAAYSLGHEVISALYNPFAFYEHNDTFNQGIGSALPNTSSWWGGAINGPGYPGNTCATTADHIGFIGCGGSRNASSVFLFKGAWGPFWVGDAPLTTATLCGTSNGILTECGEADGATPTLHPIWVRLTNGDEITYDPTTRTLNLAATNVNKNGSAILTAASGLPTGSGSTNCVTKWTSSSVLECSGSTDDGTTFSTSELFSQTSASLTPFTLNLSATNYTGPCWNNTGGGGDNWCFLTRGSSVTRPGIIQFYDFSKASSLALDGNGIAYMPSTGRFGWSSNVDPSAAACDTGLSRESAGVIDVGNCTAGDKSGQIILANLSASNSVTAKQFSTNVGTGNNVSILSLGVASGGSNFSSGAFNMGGQYWDGAAHQTDTWTLTDAVGTGTSPTSTLTVAHSGSPGAASISLPAATLPGYAVGSLPSASSLPAGTAVMVTDATTFTVGTCTGGGSDTMLAITNGTTWSCH